MSNQCRSFESKNNVCTTRRARVWAAWPWLGLLALTASCGRSLDSAQLGLNEGDGGWFEQCLDDSDCGEGQCLCGYCTLGCGDTLDCSGAGNSRCVGTEHWAFQDLCGQSSEPICVQSCRRNADCSGTDDCVGGICLPEDVTTAPDDKPDDIPPDQPPDDVPVDPSNETCPGGVVEGSFAATRQRDVDALEGCEFINGNFELVLFRGIDGRPLTSLRRVGGRFRASSSRGLALPPLPRLESVSGLSLEGINLENHPLSNLQSIAGGFDGDPGELELTDCSGLFDFSMFARVQDAARLVLARNLDLQSLAGLEGVRDLHYLQLHENHALFSLSGLGGMRPDSTSITLTNNQSLGDLFGPNWPRSLSSDLRITGNASLFSLSGLENLRDVCQVSIAETQSLQSLDGLQGLENVCSLHIASNQSLTSMRGLEGLRHVADSIVVDSNPALTEIAGLTGLETALTVSTYNNPSLTTLGQFGGAVIETLLIENTGLVTLEGLERARVKWLFVNYNPALFSLAGLSATSGLESMSINSSGVVDLDALAGVRSLFSADLNDNPNLVQIDGLSELEFLDALVVQRNPSLQRLPTFAGVRERANSDPYIVVSDNDQLLSGPEFPQLEQANYINISFNDSLPAITGFGQVRSATAIDITRNRALTDFSLPSLTSSSSVMITGNSQLSASLLAPLRENPNIFYKKIVSNSDGPTVFSPCPWENDGYCDEPFTCALGSDPSDCFGLPLESRENW